MYPVIDRACLSDFSILINNWVYLFPSLEFSINALAVIFSRLSDKNFQYVLK